MIQLSSALHKALSSSFIFYFFIFGVNQPVLVSLLHFTSPSVHIDEQNSTGRLHMHGDQIGYLYITIISTCHQAYLGSWIHCICKQFVAAEFMVQALQRGAVRIPVTLLCSKLVGLPARRYWPGQVTYSGNSHLYLRKPITAQMFLYMRYWPAWNLPWTHETECQAWQLWVFCAKWKTECQG